MVVISWFAESEACCVPPGLERRFMVTISSRCIRGASAAGRRWIPKA
jgi:hypothetical protein